MEPRAAQEPGGRPPAPESVRRQKRRELDARRSKCRIRIGGHLERWCRLKEQLGFALHSQLAQFLLDRYSSHGCTWSTGELPFPVPCWHPVVWIQMKDSSWVGCWRSTWSCFWVRSPRQAPGEPERLQPAALQRLVVLCHGQECGFVPDIQLPAAGSAAAPLVWECVAGHRFSWGGSVVPKSPSCDLAQGCAPSPGAGRRRSLRRATLGSKEAGEEGMARSPRGDGDRGQEMGDGDDGGTAPQVSLEPGPVAAAGERSLSSSSIPGDDAELGPEAREEEEEDEDFAKGDDLAYTDDLRDENYHPSLDSDSEPQRRQGQPKARRKPIKEEQPLPSPGPLEEKIGRVRLGPRNTEGLHRLAAAAAPAPEGLRTEQAPPKETF